MTPEELGDNAVRFFSNDELRELLNKLRSVTAPFEQLQLEFQKARADATAANKLAVQYQRDADALRRQVEQLNKEIECRRADHKELSTIHDRNVSIVATQSASIETLERDLKTAMQERDAFQRLFNEASDAEKREKSFAETAAHSASKYRQAYEHLSTGIDKLFVEWEKFAREKQLEPIVCAMSLTNVILDHIAVAKHIGIPPEDMFRLAMRKNKEAASEEAAPLVMGGD